MSDETDNASVLTTIYTNGNEEITVPAQVARTGFYSGGFFCGDDEITKDSFKDKALDNDIVVKAKYYAKSYTVTYVVDGVVIPSNDPALVPIYYTVSGEDVDLPSRDAPANKVFDGWYYSTDYQQKISVIPAYSSGNIVLYGRFIDAE